MSRFTDPPTVAMLIAAGEAAERLWKHDPSPTGQGWARAGDGARRWFVATGGTSADRLGDEQDGGER